MVITRSTYRAGLTELAPTGKYPLDGPQSGIRSNASGNTDPERHLTKNFVSGPAPERAASHADPGQPGPPPHVGSKPRPAVAAMVITSAQPPEAVMKSPAPSSTQPAPPPPVSATRPEREHTKGHEGGKKRHRRRRRNKTQHNTEAMRGPTQPLPSTLSGEPQVGDKRPAPTLRTSKSAAKKWKSFVATPDAVRQQDPGD